MKILGTCSACRHGGSVLLLLAAVVLSSNTLRAETTQGFPSKPVRLIVPAAPGGASDILARMIGQKLSEKWGQPVVVENKPGADSNLGADFVAKAPADGYTALVIDVSTLTMAPALNAKLNYNPRTDFAPLSMIVFSPFVLVAHSELQAKSMKELRAYALANPGKLNFASVTNATRLAAARLNVEANLDMLIVPYKGGGAALVAVSGGESNLTMASLLSTAPHIKGGRVKAIGIASSRRLDAAPEIPTLHEEGVPGFVTGSWQGLLAPAATPPDVVRKFNAAVVEILNSPDVKDRLMSQGAEVIANTADDFGGFLREDTERWSRFVKNANIKID
jgi:tripartite-type tricarboxylate transporter receptor subunit TctC